MKRKTLKLGIIAAAIAVVGGLVAGPAGATPPTGYGFDDASHVIVGGGSDTTFYTMQQLAQIWQRSDFGTSGGCANVTSVGPNINECVSNVNPELNDFGNWQHDTIAQANPVGSSTGIASLNAFNSAAYGGTVNGTPPNVDFARSSRGPKTTGGNCSGGNELTCDTFWGYGQDGIQVATFGSRTTDVQGAGGSALTATDLFHIWNCDYTLWSQVPSLSSVINAGNDGPIQPWGLNTASGTFATFQSYIQNNASGVPAGWSPNGQACDHKLVNGPNAGQFPQENDLKVLINDPTTISTAQNSTDNPTNWIAWGSFGVLSSFPFLSQPVRGGVTYNSGAAPVNGVLPSTSVILNGSYPIGRTLYHVTRKADADCPKTGSNCDFPGHPGSTSNTTSANDFGVVGGTSGISGSVREFTRFLCRPNATLQGTDPFLGVNQNTQITGALAASGFTVVPSSLRTSGSRCQVIS